VNTYTCEHVPWVEEQKGYNKPEDISRR